MLINKCVVLLVAKKRPGWEPRYFAGFNDLGQPKRRLTLVYAKRFQLSDIAGITKARKRLIKKKYAHQLRVVVA